MRELTLALACAPCLISAQSWCPPGATWTYGTDMFSLYGYARYSYVSDTLLGGQLAQRIDAEGAMSYFGQPGVDQWAQPRAAFTALIGDVVALWSGTGQAWDTLFWLGAVPGDGWLRRGGPFDSCDPPDSIVVSDTMTVVLDGLPLRRWVVQQRMNGITWGSEVFTERLGWFMNLSPYPACMIVDGPVGMRCYSDQDIEVNFTGLGCETLAGMADQAITSPLVLWPNPGSDQVTLSPVPPDSRVDVVDAMGRIIIAQSGPQRSATLSTAALAPGTYLIRAEGADGARTTLRWVKE